MFVFFIVNKKIMTIINVVHGDIQMRVSREDARENRARVVETASQLFRQHGFDGIGIAGLMKASGLTNGAFYKQFASKDALMAEATSHALAENLDHWRRSVAEDASGSPEDTIAHWYLSETHESVRGTGCAYAALAGDAPRQTKEVREAFDEALRETAALVSGKDETTPLSEQEDAFRFISQMVGALVLARATEDPDLKAALLNAARKTE
ncbi:Transcriptional regulator [Roseibium alexandrii DFL-11]|uniref:Transcriptional regulator n=2 Tax=Roseibium alexandrii TaxID=388408 RepID=A0A5E8H005_ROSAD|nr:Transcriptional regulator [Roseibium alexandrii DFL-11]